MVQLYDFILSSTPVKDFHSEASCMDFVGVYHFFGEGSEACGFQGQ